MSEHIVLYSMINGKPNYFSSDTKMLLCLDVRYLKNS